MKVGFYPGCSLTGTSREYNESVKAIARAFNITLQEVKDWNCCGATAAHSINKRLSLSLPLRILALAEEQGIEEMVVPCASCYNRLFTTQKALEKDPSLCEELVRELSMTYKGTVRIINVLQFVEKYVKPQLKERVTRPMDRKVACYYGCLLIRPHKVLAFDRVEDPRSMDEIMSLLGATALDWGFKTECCGAGLSVSHTSSVSRLSGQILRDATDRGAEAIIVACPMCHSNLDMRRPEINESIGQKVTVPVLYITQAIGLAIGLDEKELGLHRNFVPASMK